MNQSKGHYLDCLELILRNSRDSDYVKNQASGIRNLIDAYFNLLEDHHKLERIYFDLLEKNKKLERERALVKLRPSKTCRKADITKKDIMNMLTPRLEGSTTVEIDKEDSNDRR